MPRREKVQALILSRKSYGEADRLVTLFTREAGLMRVLAKGVRKIPSRRGGHLEPLTKILAIVNASHDFWYVAHVETLQYYSALRESAEATERAQHVGRLLLRVVQEGEPQPGVFDFFTQAWETLPNLPETKQVLLELGATMKILTVGGVGPSLSACQRCGVQQPVDACILDTSEGGWHCLLCHGGLLGTTISLPPRLLSVVRYAARRPEEAVRIRITDEEGLQLSRAMRAYTIPEETTPTWSGAMYGYAAG